ncbi:hypothetical protein [Aneurinibacillus migulanus]|uniref:hypothetical protein n=1 Tax=Aneurinibacillus migulanus TaxID=47500 RepID=UPI000FA742E2|nr:hypothetical protein [Aneurinibacillus migulanus]MCP1357236.1 hypothetical protein [Aneurinibacillus migulanus]
MKKISGILCLFLFFIMGLSVYAAEQDKEISIYKGESDHWSGVFSSETSEGDVTKIGKLKYKGKDLDSVGEVTCIFEAGTVKMKTVSHLDEISVPGSKLEKGTIRAKATFGNPDAPVKSVEELQLHKQ